MTYLWLCGLAAVCAVTFVPGGTAHQCEPEEYHQRGDYSDTREFWIRLHGELTDTHCSKDGGNCRRRLKDRTFWDVNLYVNFACRRPRFCKPRLLRRRIKSYCRRRGARNCAEVEESYTRSTCCRLADHLNQICKAMDDSQQTTTSPPTTSTTSTSSTPSTTSTTSTTSTPPSSTTTVQPCEPGGTTCGAMFSGVPGDTGVVQSPNYPCPYPDDAPLCIYRIEGNGGATSVTLTFDTFDVDCDDGVFVAQDNPLNPILGPSCNIAGGTSVTTTGSALAFLVLQADVSMPGNTASGFQVTYTIN